jgi:4-amino-4-deoxy-L-arabinose transferase-like glycosyltransferase
MTVLQACDISDEARPLPLIAGPAVERARQARACGTTMTGDGQAAQPGRPRTTASAPGRLAAPRLLLVILAVQAVLSARLMQANTAFQDEALYLSAGRLEFAHWLHGALLPPFGGYFSGSPFIYPPLGALAASIGGLTGARCLSLIFMLGATALLHGVTRRIFDRRPALFAAALFAGTGSTQFLGAFATYDAMALFLLALAAWLGVRAVESKPEHLPWLLAGAGCALALADCTKYATALFDPVVVVVVALIGWDRRGRPTALTAAALIIGMAVTVISAAIMAGGGLNWHGVISTTVARSNGQSPPVGILLDGIGWVGIIVLFALVGTVTIAYVGRGAPMKATAVTLTAALFLAPAEQARIRTFTSLFKHAGYGAWFGAAIAGYALASLAHAVPIAKAPRAVRLGVLAVAAATLLGAALAGNQFGNWPNSAQFVAALNPVIARASGPVLLEDDSVPAYYLPGATGRHAMVNTAYFSYTDPSTGRLQRGALAFASAISHRYFCVIALALSLPIDRGIQREVTASGNYRLVTTIGYTTTSFHGEYRIWVRTPRPA